MAIDFTKIYDILKYSDEERERALNDGNPIRNDISDGPAVLSLGWDGDFPGNSGALWINKWKKMFFIFSSDHAPEGPFSTIKDALEAECFYNVTSNPSLSSDKLSLRTLMQVGNRLVGDDGDVIYINDKKFVRKGGRLFEHGKRKAAKKKK